jgi:glycosyltransferase involved in cell wall biosynthesis
LPKRWVIVSDGSTDHTDEIIKRYADKSDFIEYVRKDRKNGMANFASKVDAIKLGYEQLNNVSYDFIGHLDADLSFDGQYYERILEKFDRNPKLGIAGGFICERYKGHFESRPFNSTKSVAGGIQLFRHECYEGIGGFIPLAFGGEDWCAEITARMRGWEVEAFSELKVFHHKASFDARGYLREHFRQGAVDFSVGSHPIFEVFKCFRRVKDKPFLLGALIRLSGFSWSYLSYNERPVPDELIRFLRAEQVRRLKCVFGGKWNLVF